MDEWVCEKNVLRLKCVQKDWEMVGYFLFLNLKLAIIPLLLLSLYQIIARAEIINKCLSLAKYTSLLCIFGQ